MENSIKQKFERDGFYVVEQLFTSEEVAALKAEIQEILEKTGQNRSEGEVRNTGVFVGLSANSETCKSYAADKRITDVLHQITGETVWFLSDKVVYKNADTDFGSPWHQDWPYWEGDHKTSIWIALDSATRENGCLKVIPGSHLEGALKHGEAAAGDKGFSYRFRPEDINEEHAVTLNVEAGTAIFFHDLLLHSSYPNISGKDRWALISTYNANGLAGNPEYKWATAAFKCQ